MELTAEQINRLRAIEKRCSELETLLSSGEISSDPERLKTVGKEFSTIESTGKLYRVFCETGAALEKCREEAEAEAEADSDMAELYLNEIESLEEKKAQVENVLCDWFEGKHVVEKRPVMIEIRCGTGGNEAGLFAGDLFRMYTRYAEIKGWKHETLSASPTALGGFKEVVLSISGDGAFNNLRYESGVHRVQRVPVTEAGGRIHTSAATVAILIEPDEVEVKIDPSELKIDTFRATGAGGQHVNKTESAIRITHLPTNTVVECQDERSQFQNRAKAMRMLRARLLERFEQERLDKISAERKSMVGSGDRSERIRTYNFPQNRITDHRAGITVYKLDLIVEGELDEVVGPLVKFMIAKELSDEETI